ncbi:MAG: hypothetical protein ACLP2P_11380, partial [Desulfobaccales bacterium]
LVEGIIAQISRNLSTDQPGIIFSKILEHIYSSVSGYLTWSLRTPDRHRPVMVSQRKSRGYMDLPPPGLVAGYQPNDLYVACGIRE